MVVAGKGNNERVKRFRANVKAKSLAHALNIKCHFPTKYLKRLPPSKLGKTEDDYGGHEMTLNFDDSNTGKSGRVVIGLRLENEKPDGRTRCKVSRGPCKSYLDAVEKSLSLFRHHKRWKGEEPPAQQDVSQEVFRTLRVEAISGARTQIHTDTCRGPTPNFCMFHGDGAEITVHLFPRFKASVVYWRNLLVIPLEYSRKRGTQLIGWNSDGTVQRLVIPDSEGVSVLDEMVPCARLPFVVVGIRRNKLQVMNLATQDWVWSPKTLRLVSYGEVMTYVKSSEYKDFIPKKRTRRFSKPHVWHKFYPWMFLHEYSGSDCTAARTHVFFRQLRQGPTGIHFQEGEKRERNFIELTEEQFLEKSFGRGTNFVDIALAQYHESLLE